MLLKKNDVVLFQGDSITDGGRNREDVNGLGMGYAYLTACLLKAKYPELNLCFLNRGISGNRVKDLRGRWKPDCLDLKPTVLSVLIGVNDTWRRYDGNDETTVEAYERDYRAILKSAKQKLKCRVVVMEPFLLHASEGQAGWREDLDPKIQAARRVAADFADVYVPLDGPLTAAALKTGIDYWLPDGVHPKEAGRAFVAQRWIEAVEAF